MNLKLHTIGKDIEGISETFGAYMAECAAVCKYTICYVSIIEFSKPEAKFIKNEKKINL